jgi:hypothetical protein
MAIHKGQEGTVKVGANDIVAIRSYSLEETADTLDKTVLGDTSRTFFASLTQFSGSVDVYWDETDTTGQGALTVGAEVQLNVYPEGDAVGDTYYQGQAIVTGITRSASFDGLVEASITVQGTGLLAEATA